MSDDNDLDDKQILPIGTADETMPTTDPSAATKEHEPRPWLQAEVKKSRKGFIVTVVVALLLVVVGGGWAAYALWYQNPEKVVMEAIGNALGAKTLNGSGTMSSHTDKGDWSLTFDGGAGYTEGAQASGTLSMTDTDKSKMSVDGQFVYMPQGDYYAKVKNLKLLYDKFQKQLTDSLTTTKTKTVQSVQADQINLIFKALFGSIVANIDGKWIKFSAQDMKNIDPALGNETDCFVNDIKKLGSEKSKLDEVEAIYLKYRFIKVSENLGSKNGDLGFVIDVDKDAAKLFVEALKTTKLYDELRACTKSGKLDIDSKALGNIGQSGVKTQLWIDQWSHRLKSVHAEGTVNEKGTKTTIKADFSTQFDAPVQVTVPTGAVDFKTVLPDTTTLFKGLFGA